MNAIVSVTPSWGIGCNNALLVRIPADLKRFRQMTEGKVVIMGHTTLRTLPHGAPLKDRTNIVLSGNETLRVEGALVCHSVEEVLQTVSSYDPDDVFVIGGESVYKSFLPYCRHVYITRVQTDAAADRTFPNLDKLGWKTENELPGQAYEGMVFHYVTYVNPDL